MAPHEVLHARGQPIESLLRLRKPLLHVSSEITKLDMDGFKPCIHLFAKGAEFRTKTAKSDIHALNSDVRLSKPVPNKSFKRREPLING